MLMKRRFEVKRVQATTSTPHRISVSQTMISGSSMSFQWKLHFPSVLLTIGVSSVVRESLSAVRRNSAGATNSFMIIPPLVSHLIFR
ncbi:hypothetical protein HAX54_040130, partial [Datura stramonium]|nr:hypothetical protein [Datura stramonium]